MRSASAAAGPALLLQLATNLVHNAIVHNLPEDGTVWIRTGVVDGAARLTVENTGEPLAAGVVATLVEPFQRGTQRVRTDHGGVGLGLAIVQSIAEAHDGALALTPRRGGGLVATVRLPNDEGPPGGGPSTRTTRGVSAARRVGPQPQPVLLPHDEHV